MHRGANRAAREAGFRLYWNAPTREDDVDRQIFLMSNALKSDTKGLILGPTNGLALTSKINEFVARRIPVVVVQTDTPIPSGRYITSVATDQNEVSKLVAERILSILDGGGEVAVVGVDRTAPETVQRSRNFIAYMSSHPTIRMVAQHSGTSFVPEAEQDAGEVLDRFPRLKVLFAVSATATEGAKFAIQRRGLSGTVALVGCDNYLVLQTDLREGRVDSAVTSDNDQMGYLAASALLDAIRGRALPPPQRIGAHLLTRDNVDAQSQVTR